MYELARPFSHYDQLTVRQKKNWTEILLSFEMRNRYEVFDQSGQAVLTAQETGTGVAAFLGRLFLGPTRPFHSEITESGSGRVLLRLHRPFRFIFHELQVSDGDGRPLGTITRRWSWLRRTYNIRSAQGQELEIFGPFFKPWTFELKDAGHVVGHIRKRWSGLGKEMFTDADNFGVELGQLQTPELKALAFAATVLIDVVHFERSKG
ncbi:MAG: phospholipid scramblase-related protein [Myxococcota bacterium]